MKEIYPMFCKIIRTIISTHIRNITKFDRRRRNEEKSSWWVVAGFHPPKLRKSSIFSQENKTSKLLIDFYYLISKYIFLYKWMTYKIDGIHSFESVDCCKLNTTSWIVYSSSQGMNITSHHTVMDAATRMIMLILLPTSVDKRSMTLQTILCLLILIDVKFFELFKVLVYSYFSNK